MPLGRPSLPIRYAGKPLEGVREAATQCRSDLGSYGSCDITKSLYAVEMSPIQAVESIF